MYKLIVVDDEAVIRNGISGFISGEGMGFDVAECFEDGKEAIEYLKRHDDVDVVITDIIMTEVSGLELAEYIYTNRPEIRVVIVSGYKEFDFAKRAMAYNVKHYMLKPTQFRDIRGVLKDIYDSLEAEKEKDKAMVEMRVLLKEQLFLDIMMGALTDPAELAHRLSAVNLGVDPDKLKCFQFHVRILDYDRFIQTKWEYGKERLNIALLNFLQGFNPQAQYIRFFSRYDTIKFVAISDGFKQAEDMERQLRKNLNDAVSLVKRYLGLDILIEFGGVFDSIHALARSGRGADGPAGFEESRYLESEKFREKFKILLSNIHSGCYQESVSILDGILDEISHFRLRILQSTLIGLFQSIAHGLEGASPALSEAFCPSEFAGAVNAGEDRGVIREICTETMKRIFDAVAKNTRTYPETVIEKAKDFMKANYHRDISLEDVANYVFLNQVYFSRFFRQQIGETFTDYLIRIRMEKAIEMLRENQYKIYEIGEKVGYKNSKYFCRLFKQYTGFTPKEYCVYN